MLGGYDPWGFGNHSFIRLPLDSPPGFEDCTCPMDGPSPIPWRDPRDPWMTPKSTPGRTRRTRRSASSAQVLSAWHRQRLHRSHEDLLEDRNSFRGGAASQAFFNLPRQGKHGLSRSVSCLSSSRRTLVKVEHDFLPQKVPKTAGFPLSRSASCHSSQSVRRMVRRHSPPEVNMVRSRSRARLRPSRSDHSISLANRPLPPTPPEEGDVNPGVDSSPDTLHDDSGPPFVKAEYYGQRIRRGSLWHKLSIRLHAPPKLIQDDQGYLEPLPPPLPPRRGTETARKWKCQEDTGSCVSSCTECLSYLCKMFIKTISACMFPVSGETFQLLSDNVQAASTPSPQTNGTMMPVRKVVVALYDYNAAQAGDLCLRKNEEFDVLDDSEEHWWKMRDTQGREGYAPSNYVKEKGNLGLQQYEWYLGDASRQRAEAILMREEKEGCFVVRNSSTNSGIYTLSVFSRMARVQVKHYHIKTDPDGMYYLSNSIKCATIPELIYRHQHNPGGLCTRLRNPPSQGRQAPATAGLSHDKWEIVPSELNLMEELGSGQFGVVRHGKLCGIDVAVKMMKEGTMSEDEFIEEAKVMTKLQHPNLVQLYGVCRRKRPIYIVTEYLKHGSLLNYLRSKEKMLIQKPDVLLDMCLQVCEGMAYLESQKFIHRDLAARNCLVGSNNVIKVGDFGLARYVVDDEYTGSGGAKFPIKWAAPEVLNYMRFSSKSDVWAFGVLMWEVSTCGKMPYGRHKNAEVVEMVQQGKILERPRFCPAEVYEVMKKCWLHSQEQRPGFLEIKAEILKVVKTFAE